MTTDPIMVELIIGTYSQPLSVSLIPYACAKEREKTVCLSDALGRIEYADRDFPNSKPQVGGLRYCSCLSVANLMSSWNHFIVTLT